MPELVWTIVYDIEKELLKGENINILAKVDKNKIDKYFFSEGFFSFLALKNR